MAVRRATKQPCVGGHGKKKPCEGRHEEAEESVTEDSVLSPNSEKRKRSESSSVKSDRVSSEELDISQVTLSSSLLLHSLRVLVLTKLFVHTRTTLSEFHAHLAM